MGTKVVKFAAKVLADHEAALCNSTLVTEKKGHQGSANGSTCYDHYYNTNTYILAFLVLDLVVAVYVVILSVGIGYD